MKKIWKLLSISFAVIQLIMFYDGRLFSEFLLDEEEDIEDIIKEKKEKLIEKKDDKISKFVSRKIKAEVIPDIKGAIRISWDSHPDSNDDYIVGRAKKSPDTMEKALRTISIKVVPAGARTEVIDSNLPAGSYYYCVLAKSKIMEREIQLVANYNYTITPAIIEKEVFREQVKIYPQQISLIYARAMNNNHIRVTWRGVESPGIIYTIYRGNTPLDSPSKLKRAEKIHVVADGKESYLDRNILKSGTYFYAITTKDISGEEDLDLIQEQSYTESGVYISLEVPSPVNNILVKPVEGGAVRISWSKTTSGVSEYMVYRYSKAISDTNRLELATFIGRVSGQDFVYIDKNIGPGNYYYAVITKLGNGKFINDLIQGDNYISDPVTLGSPVMLKSLLAQRFGSDVELTWKISGNLGNKGFKILRKESEINNTGDLRNADVIDYINITDLNYIDKRLYPGTYYYAIVPEFIEKESDIHLTKGANVTDKSIIIKEKPRVTRKERKPLKKYKPEAFKKYLPEQEIQIVKKAERIEDVIEKKRFRKGNPGIDVILEKYFLTGRYRNTFDELKELLEYSKNEYEIAKAKLFIGRTLIELKYYRKAVRYLILTDVNEHFPEESRFWRELALTRIRNGYNNIVNDN